LFAKRRDSFLNEEAENQENDDEDEESVDEKKWGKRFSQKVKGDRRSVALGQDRTGQETDCGKADGNS
jgi:hypothetical protein